MLHRSAVRLACACTLISLTALAAALPAHAAPGLRGATRVALKECSTALAQPDRLAVFEGDMRAVPGAVRLQMRFTLRARTDEQTRWTRVAAPGFGTWSSAAPGVQRYVYTKRVEDLLAPAEYRAVVAFRWLGPAGVVVARTTRRTAACRQPDPRPDLRPLRILVQPGSTADSLTYIVPIRNHGRTAAGPFAVTLTVDGRALEPAPVAGLAAGERTLLSFEGPACAPGAAVSAQVDSDGAVDERHEDDNLVTLACPA